MNALFFICLDDTLRYYSKIYWAYLPGSTFLLKTGTATTTSFPLVDDLPGFRRLGTSIFLLILGLLLQILGHVDGMLSRESQLDDFTAGGWRQRGNYASRQ